MSTRPKQFHIVAVQRNGQLEGAVRKVAKLRGCELVRPEDCPDAARGQLLWAVAQAYDLNARAAEEMVNEKIGPNFVVWLEDDPANIGSVRFPVPNTRGLA